MDEAINKTPSAEKKEPVQSIAEPGFVPLVPPLTKPDTEVIAQHADWLLGSIHSWCHEGWIKEIKGRLVVIRDIARKP